MAKTPKKSSNKAKKQKAYERKKQAYKNLPSIKIDVGEGVPSCLERAVKSVVDELVVAIHRLPTKRRKEFVRIEGENFVIFSNSICARVPPEVIGQCGWFCTIQFVRLDTNIVIELRAMQSTKCNGVTFYTWPELKVGDEQLWCSKHALERVQERLLRFDEETPSDATLNCRWLVSHCLLRTASYRTIGDGRLIAVYVQSEIADLGKQFDVDGIPLVLQAYMPTLATETAYYAKTLLTLGMRGTPEYQWYCRDFGDVAANRDLAPLRQSQTEYVLTDQCGSQLLLQYVHDNVVDLVIPGPSAQEAHVAA